MFLFNTEHSKKIWLHHTRIGLLPRGKAAANGQPLPQLPGGDDVMLSVPHCAAGRRDGEATFCLLCNVCVCPVAGYLCHVICVYCCESNVCGVLSCCCSWSLVGCWRL